MDEPWITTFTGRKFFMRKATAEDIDVHDIAHGLSNICRYVGQCNSFYSVAEHSIRMCALAPRSLRLPVLMHDSPEAYLGDMSSLLKACMPEYQEVEKHLLGVIFTKYSIKWDPTIKELDREIMAAEVRSLFTKGQENWTLRKVEYGPIIPWSAPMAEQEFLRVFRELTGEHFTHRS